MADEQDEQWLEDLRAESDIMQRLCAYATAVKAERIPLFILDVMLGVPVRRDTP